MIKVAVEPANQEVIYQSEDPSCTDSVIGPNVSEDGDFRRHSNIRSEELSEERCKGSTSYPESEGMEQKLITTKECVSIILELYKKFL